MDDSIEGSEFCAFTTWQNYIHYKLMANVHGLRDLNNDPRRQGGQRPPNVPNEALARQIPFMDSMRSDRPPLEESIPYTIKIVCFPSLKLLSGTVMLTCVLWALYVVCCVMGLDTSTGVLAIQVSVMIQFGAAQGLLISDGQVYRLLTASFLHWDLLHITMNTISLLFLMSRFEKLYQYKAIPILLAASISGYMLSVLCNRTVITAGASAMILGIIGGYIAYLVINWTALAQFGPIRGQLCCTIGFILFFSLIFSIGPNVDGFAHLGGLLGGFFTSLAILPGLEQKSNLITYVGAGCLLTMNLTTFVLFFVG